MSYAILQKYILVLTTAFDTIFKNLIIYLLLQVLIYITDNSSSESAQVQTSTK